MGGVCNLAYKEGKPGRRRERPDLPCWKNPLPARGGVGWDHQGLFQNSFIVHGAHHLVKINARGMVRKEAETHHPRRDLIA